MSRQPKKKPTVGALDIASMTVQEPTASGTVTSIGEPVPVETTWGLSYRIPIYVEVENRTIECSVFVREKTISRGVIHPRSTLFKLLTRYGCSCLAELRGKRVELRIDDRGFYRIVA